jgi:hypothetical protein
MPEEIWLFDSADGPFAIFASGPMEKNQTGLVNIVQNVWNVTELADSRRSRPLKPSGSNLGLNVYCFLSSCATHGFLVPSVAIHHLSCHYGDFRGTDYNVSCRSDGIGLQTEAAIASMKITLADRGASPVVR